VEARYADLARDGVASNLKYSPHLIVLLQHESDTDWLLPVKIRLFAANHPMLVLSPAMPERYYHFLKMLGVEHIVELPVEDDELQRTIASILQDSPVLTENRE
jgi:hypothetical protein